MATTVSVGDNDYSAFADIDFADEYLFADVQRAAPWSLKNDDAKGRGLVSATRVLQRWLLPEYATDFTTTLEVIKEACSLFAADLLASPGKVNDASAQSNVKTARAGSAQVEFFSPVLVATPLPTAIWNMLAAAGVLSAGASADSDEGPLVSGSDYGCCHAPGVGCCSCCDPSISCYRDCCG